MDFLDAAAFGAPTTGIGTAGALASGGLAYLGQRDANRMNLRIANAQMDFQERMSNTSYQRATKDMEAAGLNPMLAYSHGGASSPPGAAATMQNELAPAVNSAQAGFSVASNLLNDMVNRDRTMAEANVARAMEDKVRADTRLSVSSAGRVDEETKNLIEERERIIADVRRVEAGTWSLRSQTVLAGYKARLMEVERQLKGFELPTASNEAEAANTWYGRHVMPYLSSTLKAAGTAAGFASAGRGMRGALGTGIRPRGGFSAGYGFSGAD